MTVVKSGCAPNFIYMYPTVFMMSYILWPKISMKELSSQTNKLFH